MLFDRLLAFRRAPSPPVVQQNQTEATVLVALIDLKRLA